MSIVREHGGSIDVENSAGWRLGIPVFLPVAAPETSDTPLDAGTSVR